MRVLSLSIGILAVLLVHVQSSVSEVFFKETFDASWNDRWVQSDHKKDIAASGDFVRSAGDWYGVKEDDTGIQTSQDARFYAYSAKIPKVFSNMENDLVFQFSAKHAQKIDCGGAYFKLMPSGVDQTSFNGETDYSIMFGPDICGHSNRKTHFIINHKGENKLHDPQIRVETDQLTHVYTLIIHPDSTYEVRIDGKKTDDGNLKDHFKIELDKTIKDPEVSKPKDWVDDPMMDDPEDTKPEDWDSIPETIADPDAKMPEDWDEEDDGDWTAPMVPNPDYNGEWKPKQIKNPDYKGEWEHPMIDNPDWVEEKNVGLFKDIEYVGIEIWQVKSGTIFDNILLTDSVAEAEKFMDETYTKSKDAEKKMFDDKEEAKKKADAEAAAAATEEEDDDQVDDQVDDQDDDDLDGDDDDKEDRDEL
eukprot:203870_1